VCTERENLANPPVDPQPLVVAVNGVVTPAPAQPRFDPQQNECAVEFTRILLDSLELQPGHLKSYQEEGVCLMCDNPYIQVMLFPIHLSLHVSLHLSTGKPLV
jgi:hypothetical protein